MRAPHRVVVDALASDRVRALVQGIQHVLRKLCVLVENHVNEVAGHAQRQCRVSHGAGKCRWKGGCVCSGRQNTCRRSRRWTVAASCSARGSPTHRWKRRMVREFHKYRISSTGRVGNSPEQEPHVVDWSSVGTREDLKGGRTVSYTHLTLPTICSV
eukprot:2986271-Rhodomonas_salina.1